MVVVSVLVCIVDSVIAGVVIGVGVGVVIRVLVSVVIVAVVGDFKGVGVVVVIVNSSGFINKPLWLLVRHGHSLG